MPDPEVIERTDSLEIRSPMRPGMRVLLGAIGFFPLLAPYELLVRTEWERYLNPFFFIAAFISTGAAVLSAFVFFAAFAGLSSQMLFDRRAATFTYAADAPIVKRTRRVRALSDVSRVEVGEREWSDGAPTYYLRVTTTDGTVFETGSSTSRDEIQSISVRVDRFLAPR